MRARRLSYLVALVAVSAASPAFAQGGPPGACECEVIPPPPAATGWDGRRIAVGLHLSSIGLHADGDDAEERQFGGGGLTIRYRLGMRWELGFTTDAGEERDADGDVTASLGSMTFAAMYHVAPHRRWDLYLLAGLGGTAIAEAGDTAEPEARGHVHLGIGLERRFGRLGVAAELRLVGVGPREDDETAPVRTGAMAVPDSTARPDDGLSGGLLSLGATYHF